jgi:hypothetical protein
MGVTVAGTSLASLVWNVSTRSGRMATAPRRGGNAPNGARHGAAWRAKPLDELSFELQMWLLGSNTDGTMPADGSLRQKVRDRYDQLCRLFNGQQGLVELVDTDSARRTFVELESGLEPVMTGPGRAEVVVALRAPSGCWEDTAAFSTASVVLPASGPVTLNGAGGGTLPLFGLTIRLKPPGRNIRVTASSGAWVQFNGDLPVGNDTEILLGESPPDARQIGSSTSLMSSVRWAFGAAAEFQVPLLDTADPVVQVTSEAGSGASRIQFFGRRKWVSA